MNIEFHLFGGFEVRIDNRPMPSLRSRREQWMLALLVLRHDRETSREWLATTLWPDNEEKQALFYLRKSLSNLRQALGGAASRLSSPTPRTIRLDLQGAKADVVEFEIALERASTADDPTTALREAVALYTGPLLPDCQEEWAAVERNQREQAYLRALERLAYLDSEKGDPAAAVHWLRLLVASDPYRESAYCAIMQALADCGDQAALKQSYQELRLLLRQDLNTSPSPETEALYNRLINSDKTAKLIPAPSSDSAATRRHLPIPLTELIGREDEIDEVVGWLGRRRMVCLIGAGGIGKTRLSIAVADRMQNECDQGVWFVDLAPLSDPALVPNATAKALGIAENQQLPITEALSNALKSQKLLLVLDNCEHLQDAPAILALNLLSTCSELRIIATSRHPLGVTGEQVYTVPTLAFPILDTHGSNAESLTDEKDPHYLMEYDSIRLFVDRASRIDRQFRLSHRNSSAVVDICWQLDGIPLAIEMATARLRSMSVTEIRDRLADRFRLLTTGNRGALPRQQTLRAAIDWSYELLNDEEKTLFCRLSVFAGGWTLEGVESLESRVERPSPITDYNPNDQIDIPATLDSRLSTLDSPSSSLSVPDVLASLADKSVVIRKDEGEGSVRYTMLESIRHYAHERLELMGETTSTRRAHRDFFLTLAESVEPNLRGANQAYYTSLLEAEHDNFRAALAFCSEDSDGAEASLRFGRALWLFWANAGYLREGYEQLQRILSRPEALNDSEFRADVLNGAGTLCYLRSDYVSARSMNEAALRIGKELGSNRAIAAALNGLGNVAVEMSDYPGARAHYEQSLNLQRQLANTQAIPSVLGNLGRIAYMQGDYPTARTMHQECLAICRSLDDRHGIGRSLYHLGIVAFCERDYKLSRSLGEESLAIRRELGQRQGIAESLNMVAIVANEAGDYATARALHEEGLAIQRTVGNKWGIAAALANLGTVNQRLGDRNSALSLYREGLVILGELGDRRGIAETVGSIGSLAHLDENYVYAIRLWGAAFSLRESAGSVLPPSRQEELDVETSAARDAVGRESFDDAWQEGMSMTMEDAVRFALSNSPA